MPRPQQVEASALLKTITGTPVKPSELAKVYGVSRATIHRKLEALLAEGLVVREGAGPRAAYRLPSRQEVLDDAAAKSRVDGQVRMVVDKSTAQAIREGVETFCRLGIGQLEEIRQEASLRNGKLLPYAALEELSALSASLKHHLMGLSPNGSFGIYNPNVHPEVLQAWALMKTLRHRLAWDQTPEGSMGVWHDEPLIQGDSIPGLAVMSDTPDADGKPSRYLVEMPRESVAVLGRAVKTALRLQTGEVSCVLDMHADGLLAHHSGKPVSAAGHEASQVLVARMEQLLRGDDGLDVKLSPGQVRMLRVVKACEAFAESGKAGQVQEAGAEYVQLGPIETSQLALNVDQLPEGMMLNFKDGKYRVIAPTQEDQVLTIIAESVSLQTVVQRARNRASGASTGRSW